MDCGRWDTNAPLRYEDVTPRLLSEAANGKRLGLDTAIRQGTLIATVSGHTPPTRTPALPAFLFCR